MSSNLMDSAQNSTEDEPKDHTIQEHAVDKRTSASEEDNVMNQDGLEESPESTPPSALPGYLPWEEDMEMVSKYLDRKDDLEESYKSYLQNNPELRAILADFMQAVLIQKPDDVYQFARDYFIPYASNASATPSFLSHRVNHTSSD